MDGALRNEITVSDAFMHMLYKNIWLCRRGRK